MYILIATIDGVETGLYLCKKIFSDLETAKKAGEDYLSTDAVLSLDIYKVEPDGSAGNEFVFIGDAAYYE